MQEAEIVETWNKKKIIVSFFVIILLAACTFLLKNYILGSSFFKNNLAEVKGVSTENEADINNSDSSSQSLSDAQKAIQEKLETVKQEMTNLNAMDIISSSPQFQKIVDDLRSLQQYPHSELKDVCKTICGN